MTKFATTISTLLICGVVTAAGSGVALAAGKKSAEGKSTILEEIRDTFDNRKHFDAVSTEMEASQEAIRVIQELTQIKAKAGQLKTAVEDLRNGSSCQDATKSVYAQLQRLTKDMYGLIGRSGDLYTSVQSLKDHSNYMLANRLIGEHVSGITQAQLASLRADWETVHKRATKRLAVLDNLSAQLAEDEASFDSQAAYGIMRCQVTLAENLMSELEATIDTVVSKIPEIQKQLETFESV